MLNKELIKMIKESKSTVFFGGAGVSTESGIPDFRSEAGIYRTWSEYGRPPEEIICRPFFDRKPEIFFNYYRKNLLHPDAKPNPAHYTLAQMERRNLLNGVITQNIDGLHQKAGSRNVVELHGSTLRNYCMNCKKAYGVETIMENNSIPLCPVCGGIIKPDIVLYQEELDNRVIRQAEELISKTDTLIVGGTSLVVYPAAGLVEHFRGRHLVLINKTATQYDKTAELVITRHIGQVFEELAEHI